MTNDFHLQCRRFVRDLIEADRVLATPTAGLAQLREVKEMDEFDADKITGPAVAVYFFNTPTHAGGTMMRDDWKFPVVVALKTTGVLNGGRSGPHPTTFLAAIYDLFHNRRPATVPSGVWKCEIDQAAPTITEESKYQDIKAATTVVLTARFNRRR